MSVYENVTGYMSTFYTCVLFTHVYICQIWNFSICTCTTLACVSTVCYVRRGNITFWRSSVRVVVGAWVINAVTVGGGQATGVDEILVGFTLVGCWRG